ncbi:MFS general substrate transporter [Trametes coccinea BRFM310]|uniref:MFS general substrate transporter n=1 Tax=Trametes coccinea (strain BRFM310) TaxID=1353009 RepID=A0A1Y2IXU1_TRAC3|nr:MFS general substrate transporter [Trametes coccinea BRFM310]
MQAPENHPEEITHPHDFPELTFSEQQVEISDIEKIPNSPLPNRHETYSGPSPVRRGKTRLSSAFFAYFVVGWGDGVTGTLLPHFKSDLHLSFLLSSLFWVASASGYALGTISVEYVTRFLGRTHLRTNQIPTAVPFSILPTALNRRSRRSTIDEPYIVAYSQSRSRFYTLLSASILHAVFFIIMGSKSGYPSMMVAYVISAFARSFISATLNVYVPSVSKKGLGFLYGSTSVGGFAAPLVCQSIIATGIRWADFYFGSLVLSALNTLVIIYAFWPTQDELQSDADLAWELHRSTASPTDDPSSTEVEPQSLSPAGSTAPILRKKSVLGPRTYKTALKQMHTWTSALFALIYTGSESATQGFIVVYLLAVRNANPNTVGYVTSGFWGGMALSRFIWGYLGGIITFRQRKWIVQACM